jgi:hypothetical protein
MSPTQRTLKLMKDQGYFIQVVERTIPYKFIKVDLFNWIDLVAVHPKRPGIVGIQTTSGGNLSARIHKAAGNGALVAWLLSGNRLLAHGWRKLKGRWAVDEREIRMEDLTREREAKVTADPSFRDGESVIP